MLPSNDFSSESLFASPFPQIRETVQGSHRPRPRAHVGSGSRRPQSERILGLHRRLRVASCTSSPLERRAVF